MPPEPNGTEQVFPTTRPLSHGEAEHYAPGCAPDSIPVPGMSLRDWFAGMAMQGLVQRTDGPWNDAPRVAYQIASMMLDRRKPAQPPTTGPQQPISPEAGETTPESEEGDADDD